MRNVEKAGEYVCKCRIEAVLVRIIGDVVSINCLSIDWLMERDVMPLKSEQPPQFSFRDLAVKRVQLLPGIAGVDGRIKIVIRTQVQTK